MHAEFLPLPPITLLDHGDLDVFADVASAVHDIDPDDVRRGRAAFDALGRPLHVLSNGDWPVGLAIVEDAIAVPHHLEHRLRSAVRDLGPAWSGLTDFESAPLAALLDAMLRFQTGVPHESVLGRLTRKLSGRRRAEPLS